MKKNKGFMKAWNSAYKRPMFYIFMLVDITLITLMFYILSIEFTKNTMLLMLTIGFLLNEIWTRFMDWVETDVLNPKGFSMESKRKDKRTEFIMNRHQPRGLIELLDDEEEDN